MLGHFVEHTQCMHWTRPERAYCTMPRPSRHAGPPGFGPHGSTSPRTPRLAASRQTTLARYSAAARAFLAALQRRQCASATGSTAQASPARHLAPGAVPARPLVPAVIPSHATLPCKLQRGGSPASSSTAAEPTSSRYKRRPPSPFEHSGDLKPPP